MLPTRCRVSVLSTRCGRYCPKGLIIAQLVQDKTNNIIITIIRISTNITFICQCQFSLYLSKKKNFYFFLISHPHKNLVKCVYFGYLEIFNTNLITEFITYIESGQQRVVYWVKALQSNHRFLGSNPTRHSVRLREPILSQCSQYPQIEN